MCLLNLRKWGIEGKVYSWMKNVLCSRKTQIKINKYSQCMTLDNGVPQGSVIVFKIMINDIYKSFDNAIRKLLFDDDALLWKQGRNAPFICKGAYLISFQNAS